MDLMSDKSLSGRLPADDMLFGMIANFLTPESLTFSANLAHEIFCFICGRSPRGHHMHVAELGNLCYIHVYEWDGGQKVKQVHHTSVPSDCEFGWIYCLQRGMNI